MEDDFIERLNRESEEMLQKILTDAEKNISTMSKQMVKEAMDIALRKIGTTHLFLILKAAQEHEHYEVCQAIYEILPERVMPHIK